MMLVIDLLITVGSGELRRVEQLQVRRLTSLHSRNNPEDEVHRYSANRVDGEGNELRPVTFTHRYGDGAWKCTLRALEALEKGDVTGHHQDNEK